jgi:hypothetical protein
MPADWVSARFLSRSLSVIREGADADPGPEGHGGAVGFLPIPAFGDTPAAGCGERTGGQGS